MVIWKKDIKNTKRLEKEPTFDEVIVFISQIASGNKKGLWIDDGPIFAGLGKAN